MDILQLIITATINYAAIMLVVALGGMFSERSGVINIALDGTMIVGALAGSLFLASVSKPGTVPDNPMMLQLVTILISAFAGGIYSLLLAFASVNLKADQTIGGTALNLLGAALAVLLSKIVAGNVLVRFSKIGFEVGGGIYLTTIVIFVIMIVATIILYKTKFGLRLRACGEHPQAADALGINVYKMRYAGVIISGCLGGIGGLQFIIPFLSEFNAEAGVMGYGFLALAVMIFGNWNPIKILFASLFFGFFTTIGNSYSAIPWLYEFISNKYVYKALPYIATMIILIFSSKHSRAPKAEGIAYDKGLR